MFELDDLDDESLLLVLCARAHPDKEDDMRMTDQVYVWQGGEFEEIQTGSDILDQQTFVQKCIENYWGAKEAKRLAIEPVFEIPTEESDEFMYYF